MLGRGKKFSLGILAAIVVFVSVFSLGLFAPRRASAQMDNQINASFLAWQGIETSKGIIDKIKEEGLFMVMSAIMNGLNYFTNKIAYDMAVWMASGDWGQGPFASSESFGNYLAQTAGDSLGEALGSLSKDLGLNLCDLPDLRLDLLLQLGFHFNYGPPKPTCTWQQLKSAYNLENIRSQYASVQGLTSRVSLGVQVQDTDFGIWLKSKESIDTIAAEQSTGASLDRQEGDGIFPMSDIISGKTRIPASVMREEMNAQSAAAQKEGRDVDKAAMLGAALQKGGVSIALNTVSTFVNTLLGTVLNNFLTEGLLPGGAKVCNPGLSISGVGWEQCDESETAEYLAGSYYGSGDSGGQRRAAQEMFSEYLLPKIKTVDNYNIIGTMADCSPDNLLPEACTIDQSFLQILQIGDQTGEPLTIKQALEQGYLHGDWPLISYNDAGRNTARDCAQSAYCHRNIQFLRLMRILPLGFEIAARYSPADNPITLQEVVDCYYDSGGSCSSYYGLINPYWVIKYPKTRCNALSYSSIALPGGIHLETCADIQHCVAYNKDGSCASWGYCLREQPIWKIGANYCDKQFATCRAFASTDGDTGSYLVRTLDTQNCNADNDGCTRYSRYKFYLTDSIQDWFGPGIYYDTSASTHTFYNNSLYFNKKMPTCDSSQDGCSAFKLASDLNTTIFLKKAPDYLGCYDADSNEDPDKLMLLVKKIHDGINWPVTLSDLNLINPQDPEACKNYAQVCLPEEENCNYYTSALTGDTVPGKFTPAVIDGGYVTWNDQCDAKCVGYAAYREMPSNYTNGENLSYIIPSSGKSCSASEVGCSSFTNLSTEEGGLEKNEYFSYLRLCALPDQNIQRNYTVYESSESGGYQIKTYTLVKNDDGEGPKQIFRDVDVYDDLMPEACSETAYNNGTADPDCHQFIAGNGEIYYALLSKTIVVSDQCTPYRLNNTELWPLGSQLRCPYDLDPAASDGRAGTYTVEFKNNSCYYMGFTGNTGGAGNSVSCTKDVETCRAYKGNAGYNVRTLLNENFEDEDFVGDWEGNSGANLTYTQSTESTQIDGHSMKLTATNISYGSGMVFNDQDFLTLADKQYMVSFWAKGNLAIAEIGFMHGTTNYALDNTQVTPTGVWRSYTFGPFDYEDIFGSSLSAANDSLNAYLTISVGQAGATPAFIFIDNLKVTEVADYLYLVKDSLSVDPICDSSPNDNLPGEALGCMAYKTPAGTTFNLTNFSYLCREAAVGCTAVIDTYNTPDDPYYRVFNIWIRGSSGNMATVTVEGKTYSCQVPVGKTGCYTNMTGIQNIQSLEQPTKLAFLNSTQVIHADTPSSSPIYLVASKGSSCKAENMGCEVLGRAVSSASGLSYWADIGSGVEQQTHYETFTEVAVKNDPALYDTVVCQAEARGCKAWSSGESSYYFKNPNFICEYKEEFYPPSLSVTYYYNAILDMYLPIITGGLYGLDSPSSGWVWKDVGACSLGDSTVPMGRFCTSDSDCVIAETDVTGKCLLKGQIPCYSSLKDTLHVPYPEYQIVSYGTTNLYHSFVGECPAEQSGCSQFVDHSSSIGETKKCLATGKKCDYESDCNEVDGDICVPNLMSAYYLIENEKLNNLQAECNGKVSQAEGCVLLDKTSNPNKYWDTSDTYDASFANNEAMTTPVSSATNDANMILKVIHDRECAEWAYCDLKQEYEDEDTGEIAERCYHLGACDKAGILSQYGQVRDCGHLMPSWDTQYKELTRSLYRNLLTAWDSKDFSGYSTFETYQLPDLSARRTTGGDDKWHLVFVTSSFSFTSSMSGRCDPPPGSNNENCGPASNPDLGKCYNGECLVGYAGGDPNSDGGAPVIKCRAYAEATAPFMPSILKDTASDVLEYKEGYEGANICMSEYDNPVSCDYNSYCSYRKIKTNAGEIYKQIDEILEKQYLCTDGPNKGRYCSGPDSTACGEGYSCASITNIQVMQGWMGYCMNYDARQKINGDANQNYCLQWWPIQSPPGVPNFWEADPNAAYELGEGDQDRFMCLENEEIINKNKFDLGGSVGFVYGGEMIGIDTGDSDYDDYNIQVFPKNSSYRIIGNPAGNSHDDCSSCGDNSDSFAVTNLSANAAVSGCWFASADAYNYGFQVSNSAGLYCPINSDTLIIDGSSDGGENPTMAVCESPSLEWNSTLGQYECSRWSYWDHHSGYCCTDPDADPPQLCCEAEGDHTKPIESAWISSNYNAKYFHMNEIERIDVFIDNIADAVEFIGDGWVSLIRDAVDADDGGRSFVHQSSFVDSYGQNEIHTADLSSINLPGWIAWEWQGGSGNPDWTIADDSNSKNKIVTDGIKDDSYYYMNVSSEYEGEKNISVRAVFDEDRYFRGIWLNGEGSGRDGAEQVGFFFVIHFTHGKCNKFAQVSTASPSPDKPFGYKVYTNRMSAANEFFPDDSLNTDIFRSKRVKDLNGGKYGLAYTTGYVNISNTNIKAAYINPFTPYKTYGGSTDRLPFDHSQSGSTDNNYGSSYNAGVPLTVAHNKEGRSDQSDYFIYSISSDDYSYVRPYGSMLRNMFAKVYNIWTLSFSSGLNNGYSSSGGVDASHPDNLSDAHTNVYPPRVAAPSSVTGGWELDKISVGGQTSGDIYILSGTQLKVKFYAWAHGNQMPIRRIVMDKGDGIWVDTGGGSDMQDSIGNRKWVCAVGTCGSGEDGWQYPCNGTTECAPLYGTGEGSTACYNPASPEYRQFGNTTDTGCKNKPWDFSADYNCPFGTSVIIDHPNSSVDWPQIQSQYGFTPTYVCRVQPRVHVLDNWGWCTGSCSTNDDTGYTSGLIRGPGCFSERTSSSNDCSTSGNRPWIYYDGYVYVIPIPT